MVIGVGVDFAMHIAYASRAAERAGHAPGAAAVEGLRSVGRPVAVGALTTATAFVILAFSQNSQLRQFGVVASVVVVAAFVVSLLLVPILVAGRSAIESAELTEP